MHTAMHDPSLNQRTGDRTADDVRRQFVIDFDALPASICHHHIVNSPDTRCLRQPGSLPYVRIIGTYRHISAPQDDAHSSTNAGATRSSPMSRTSHTMIV